MSNCDSKCIYVKRKELYELPKDGGIYIALHASYYWICIKHGTKSNLPPAFNNDPKQYATSYQCQSCF